MQYESVKDKYDLSEFKILESIKLADSIDDYRDKARLLEVEMLVNVCKKEMDKIESIEVVYTETKKVGSNISEVNKTQSGIKVKFKKSKEEVKKLSNFEEELKKEVDEQQKLVNSMYEEASKISKDVRHETIYKYGSGLISSMLRIAGGILTLPLSGLNIFGVTLGTTLINRGLKGLNRSIETKEKIIIDYKYEDLSNKLSKVEDKLEYINLTLADSLNEIARLKNNITIVFLKYKDILPDYEATLNKVLNLEEKLVKQQEKMKNIGEKEEEEKKLKKEKIYKIGEMKRNDNN